MLSKQEKDPTYLGGLEKEGFAQQFTLITNLLDAATYFFDKEKEQSSRIIQATFGSLNKALKTVAKSEAYKWPKPHIIGNLLKKCSFDYHPSQVGKRSFNPTEFNFHGVHEQLIKLLGEQLKSELDKIETNDRRPSVKVQSTLLTFTLLCLRHYLFFEGARLKISDPSSSQDKHNVSKIINQREDLSAIYDSLQKMTKLCWKDLKTFKKSPGSSPHGELYMILFELCSKYQLTSQLLDSK